MSGEAEEIDWNLCTFDGAEREQLRRWVALPLRTKLEALEEMGDRSRRMIASRQERGLPYFDPATGELVPGRDGS